MKNNKNRMKRQLVLISFLLIVGLFSAVMIYLGATVFRSHLPFFQLIDSDKAVDIILEPKPAVNPGVVDVDPESLVNMYMVLGSDFRPESGYRTDTLILVALDKKSGKASMVSFPRDLWVSIPGYSDGRINTAMQLGGFQLLANTLQTNFGVYPTQYAMIDMEGFLEVIDTLGGIEFTTEYYTGDACDGSLDPDRWCEVGPGEVSLNSEMALWYVRARYNSSDFDRMRRTQEVVKAVFEKVATPGGMIKVPQLMKIYESEVESNIPTDSILPLVELGLKFNSNEDVRRFVIGPNEVTSWITAEGANVLLPNGPAIQDILQEALRFE